MRFQMDFYFATEERDRKGSSSILGSVHVGTVVLHPTDYMIFICTWVDLSIHWDEPHTLPICREAVLISTTNYLRVESCVQSWVEVVFIYVIIDRSHERCDTTRK